MSSARTNGLGQAHQLLTELVSHVLVVLGALAVACLDHFAHEITTTSIIVSATIYVIELAGLLSALSLLVQAFRHFRAEVRLTLRKRKG